MSRLVRSSDVPKIRKVRSRRAGTWSANSVSARRERPYRALDFTFSATATDPALERHLADLFAALAPGASGIPDHRYEVLEDGPAERPAFTLTFDGAAVCQTMRAEQVLARLLWHVNRQVVARSNTKVLVHAAAAEHGGVALLFPAAMESGKSTLVAALVRTGLGYLTDETVGIDPASLLVHPYQRAISLDPGSWQVLPDLEPRVAPGAWRYRGRQWQVAPTSIRPGCLTGPVPARFVITPQYRAGAVTNLEPISRANAVSVLAEHSFNLRAHGASGLRTLAAIVRGCDCFRLTIADLDDACAFVMRLLEGSEGGRMLRGAGP